MSLPLRSYEPLPDTIAPRETRLSLWRALPPVLYWLVRSGGDGFTMMQELFKSYHARTLCFFAGSVELELTIDPERVREIFVEEWREHRNAPGVLFSPPAMERFAGQVTRAFAARAEQWLGGVFDMEWSREASAIANQARLSFIGSGSTTTHLLGWCGQLLADHPEAQTQLRDELHALGLTPTLQELESAPYLEAVILEALRLFPPAPFLLRRRSPATRSYSVIPIQVMHRSEEYWERPDEFSPERWLSRNGTVIAPPPYYHPFGAGPGVCVGKNFALIELRVILSELVRRYRVVPAIATTPSERNIILTRPSSPVMLFCLPAYGLGTGVATLMTNEKASDPGRRYDRPGGE